MYDDTVDPGDAAVAEFMMSEDMENAIIEKAREIHPDAFALAIETGDEEVFFKIWQEATRLAIDDILTSLMQKGIVEAAGMTADGDMTFGLTPLGKDVRTEIEKRDE